MKYKITGLGGAGRPITKIARDIVNYLRPRQPDGYGPSDAGPRQERPGAYYADGGDEPGVWKGRGAAALGLRGAVADDDFARVLEGRDPATGERLITAQGSAGRRPALGSGAHTRLSPDGVPLYGPSDIAAVLDVTRAEAERMVAIGHLLERPAEHGVPPVRQQPPGTFLRSVRLDGQLWVTEVELERCRRVRETESAPAPAATPGDVLRLAEAAAIAGVSREHLRGRAREYEDNHADIEELAEQNLPWRRNYLRAHRGSGDRWLVVRAELDAHLARRRAPNVRVGFDLTLTTEKSLGVHALLSGPAHRAVVLRAIEGGNDWALAWLEEHAARTRAHGEVVPVGGWTVASFRHFTSRALDPFPHHHNVIANTVEDHHGVRRALDARKLHAYTPAASALATAEMRYLLTTDLGVGWRLSAGGSWEVDRIPDVVLREFSRRRNEIEDAVQELKEAIGRDVKPEELDQVALSTRSPKTHAAVGELFDDWWQRAEALGFSPEDLARCAGAWAVPPEPAPEDIFKQLAAPAGLCQNVSVFNYSDVLQALVNLPFQAEGQTHAHPLMVPARRLEELAEAFLTRPDVILIKEENERDLAKYSTSEMLALQDRLLVHYAAGLQQDHAVVPAATLGEVLSRHPRLTDEQSHLVTAFCTGGHRIQTAVGRPGAGKTTSMRVAREAWEAADLRVIGAAVKGEAARTLAIATGIPTETLAWYLAHDDPLTSPLDARTVLVVDEASTVSDRDLDRLIWLAHQTGATLRLIGDPKQHGAVEAGGMFGVICNRNPDETPELSHTHRLRNPHDRAAAEALRAGDFYKTLAHLARAGHVHIVEDEIDAYIQVLISWWHAHLDGLDHPMVDRRNSVRHTLNQLAHALRRANGELGHDHMMSGDREFAVGDRVIARRPDRRLRADGDSLAYVRNGAVGTVEAVHHGENADEDALVVAFDDIGTIELPRSFVDEREVARGRSEVGVDYAYAVTSYAVTGATQPMSTSRIDEKSSRAEAYVDITRGEQANHLFLTRAADPLDGEYLPRTPAAPIAEAIAGHLEADDGEKTAWEIRQGQLDKVERRRGGLSL